MSTKVDVKFISDLPSDLGVKHPELSKAVGNIPTNPMSIKVEKIVVEKSSGLQHLRLEFEDARSVLFKLEDIEEGNTLAYRPGQVRNPYQPKVRDLYICGDVVEY
ncbi:MAG: hypothetical protein JNN15_15515 [Blastocatellia bacterium]|nr:hypothetical protein [Blastocatellia bacterium]